MDHLEGMEMMLEILGDADAVARISESLAALGRGEPGADVGTRSPGFGTRSCHGRVTEPEHRYEVRFQPAARRAIATNVFQKPLRRRC